MTRKQLSRRRAEVSSSAKIDLIILTNEKPVKTIPKSVTFTSDMVETRPQCTVILCDRLELLYCTDCDEVDRTVDIMKQGTIGNKKSFTGLYTSALQAGAKWNAILTAESAAQRQKEN